ncbi:MAG: molybdopterin molybdotransferase MoeA [bacterium]|nr:molybdopterin molybdotransferase MoeA [bacterium]
MISFEDAKQKILEGIVPIKETEEIKVISSLNHILASDIIASFDIPPHNNSAMDGYALRYEDISQTEEVRLKVIGELPAGKSFDRKIKTGEALRIMTGAPMPKGADTVVIQEVTLSDGDWVSIPPLAAKFGANVRLQGEDIKKGELILQRGTRIRPQEMGMLASMGYGMVNVYRQLKVAIISTGDELISIGEKRAPGKIYDSNRYCLTGLLTSLGVEIIDLGIVKDARDLIEAKFKEASERTDVVITSGGVSVGKYDLVREVVDSLGKVEFWQVKIKPGKPLSFGKIGNCYFFGLPGNPVSVIVSFIKFVRCGLLKMAGCKEYDKSTLFKARANFQMSRKQMRLEWLRGILSYGEDGWVVTTTGPQGSGILRSMISANCLIQILPEQMEVVKGDEVWVEPLEWG